MRDNWAQKLTKSWSALKVLATSACVFAVICEVKYCGCDVLLASGSFNNPWWYLFVLLFDKAGSNPGSLWQFKSSITSVRVRILPFLNTMFTTVFVSFRRIVCCIWAKRTSGRSWKKCIHVQVFCGDYRELTVCCVFFSFLRINTTQNYTWYNVKQEKIGHAWTFTGVRIRSKPTLTCSARVRNKNALNRWQTVVPTAFIENGNLFSSEARKALYRPWTCTDVFVYRVLAARFCFESQQNGTVVVQ